MARIANRSRRHPTMPHTYLWITRWKRQARSLLVASIALSTTAYFPCFAQSSKTDSDPTAAAKPSESNTAVGGPNAAILKELATMRARIDELEAQLKHQQEATASSAATSPDSMHDPNAEIAIGAAPSSSSSRAAETTLSTAPALAAQSGKKSKAEPFAFADFSWLNGNPRTKEVPLDTKFFTPEIRADIDYTYDF